MWVMVMVVMVMAVKEVTVMACDGEGGDGLW